MLTNLFTLAATVLLTSSQPTLPYSVVFTSTNRVTEQTDIFSVTSDGTVPKQLAHLPMAVNWSTIDRVSETIVFTNNSFNLYFAPLTNIGQVSSITLPGNVDVPSAVGGNVAAHIFMPTNINANNRSGIVLINLASRTQRIYKGAPFDNAGTPCFLEVNPFLSPNRSSVIGNGQFSPGGVSSFFRMSLADGSVAPLKQPGIDPWVMSYDLNSDTVYGLNEPDAFHSGEIQFFSMNLDGSNLKLWTGPLHFATGGPILAPDRQHLYFVCSNQWGGAASTQISELISSDLSGNNQHVVYRASGTISLAGLAP